MSGSQEIDIVLDEILEVEGVAGVFTMNTHGEVIAARMPSIYDYESLNMVSKKLIKTLRNIQAFDIDFDDIAFNYTDIRLVVKNLRNGYLVIMNLPTISVPLLNVATKSASKRITEILNFPKSPQPE